MLSLGFKKSDVDLNLYFKVVDGEPLILLLYVEDLFLAGAKVLTDQCKRESISEFEMKDLGLTHYYLGLEIWQKPDGIFVVQASTSFRFFKYLA